MTCFSLKYGEPKEVKNGPIMLKFYTIVDWMNTCGCYFYFLKIFLFWDFETLLRQTWAKY